ncbi:MAG: hypothetical protein K2L07_14485 [Lachnospiraceae bacterium]|nr:hypothetical protein [Lachnospiraceae bacterium]
MKMIQKSYIWFGALSLICLISGCARVPDTEDGTKAVNSEGGDRNAKQFIQNIGQETDLSAYDFLEPEEKGYSCRITFAEGENKITVDALVEQTGLETVPILTAKVLGEKLDEEKIKSSFFRGLEVYDAADEVRAEIEADKENEDYEVVTSDMMKSDPANDLVLRGQKDESLSFDRYAAGIQYAGEEYGQVKALDTTWGEADATMQEAGEKLPQRVWFGKDIREDFTESVAWDTLCSAMEQIGITDLKKICGRTFCDSEGQGYYAFSFTRCIEGIPLMSGEAQAQRNPLCVIGEAEVTADGVADIQADNILWETLSSEDTQCINVGQFIELVSQYLKDGKITGDGSITFNHVELTYMMVTKDWETAEFKPVWRMYVPLEELLAAEGNVHGSMEFVVDAVTGEIINQISY